MGVNLGGGLPAVPERPTGPIQAIENALQGVGGVIASLAQGVDALLGQLSQAIRGVFTFPGTSHPALDEIQDGQKELIDRMDLVGKLSGYVATYMPVNIYTPANEWRTAPFRTQLGPAKNATVDGDGRITLAQGTWQVSAHITSDQHANLPVRVRIEVIRPDNTRYSIKETRSSTITDRWNTYTVLHTAICPDPGYQIRARIYYEMPFGLNLLWRGGTALSHFTAIRLDLDASNAVVDEDVPTEGSA